MSPRAAWRLEALGFTEVYDYTLGKVDWLAAGGASEGAGARSRRALDALVEVPSCRLDQPADEAIAQAREAGWDLCVVLNGAGVVAGVLRAADLDASEARPASEAMRLGPATIRPNEELDAVRQRMGDRRVTHLLVTTPEGHLLGAITTEDSHAPA